MNECPVVGDYGYDRVTQASMNGIYVKARELDRGQGEYTAPAAVPPGVIAGGVGVAPGDAVAHASDMPDAMAHASDGSPRADEETHVSDGFDCTDAVSGASDGATWADAETHASDGSSRADAETRASGRGPAWPTTPLITRFPMTSTLDPVRFGFVASIRRTQ